MTMFRFTPTFNAHTTGPGAHAFESDSPGADTLIVDANAYVRADGAGAFAALLHNTKAWTVQVNGLVHSQQSLGIGVDSNNTATSSISVGAAGVVYGGTDGVYALSAINIKSAGKITGGTSGVSLGVMAVNTINNTGEIAGATWSICDFFGQSTTTVKNSGTLNGMVYLGDRADTLTNSGTILGVVETRGGNDRVVNTGRIGDRVELGDGDDKLTNSGSIANGVRCGAGNDVVTNSGTIGNTVYLGDGLNTLTNSGLIDGTLFGGAVFGGADRDVVKNSGTILGLVDLAGGDDSFTGGKSRDFVVDGAGSDSFKFGGGDDVYYARGENNPAHDGIDSLDGGAGTDIYYAGNATESVSVNLDKIAHDFSPFVPGAGMVAANTAFGVQVGTDKIKNFEDATGGSGSDVIYGSAAANRLSGGKSGDMLFGFGGDDTLIGGEGGDGLIGGTGRDLLYGESGNDVFVFTNIADSGTSATRRDTIKDFESGGDIINLVRIDAITTNGSGDDAFNFIGDLSFSGVAGQLRAYATAGGQMIEGDVNGDGKADFAIEVALNTVTATLTAADFLL